MGRLDTFRAAGWMWVLTVFLLPFGWFPPLPLTLHPHMQGSDIVFAITTVPWLLTRPWTRVARSVALPLAVWIGLATLTAATRGGATKLVGTVMLTGLMLVSADLSRDARWCTRAAWATAASIVLLALLGVLSVGLFYAGVPTPLLGDHGDLLPGPYPRVRATTFHPNLLGSYAIFAAAAVGMGVHVARAGRTAALLAAGLALSRSFLGVLVALAWSRGSAVRRLVTGIAVAIVVVLSVTDLRLDPTRPWLARLEIEGGVRRQAVVSALSTVARFPLLGCGLECSPGIVGGVAFDAHNTPVQVAATRGLPALVALVWLVAGVLPGGPAALHGGVMALGIDALAQDVEDLRHVWVLLGLVLGSRRHTGGEVLTGPGA